MSENKSAPEWFYAFKDSNALRIRVNTHTSLRDLPPSFEKVTANNWALGCLNCGKINVIPICNNCTNTSYRFGFNKDNILGLFCTDCQIGFINLKCSQCGSVIPITHKTLLKEKSLIKSGCFVVTATVGDAGSYEVKFLSMFRDNYLISNKFGKLFVENYYKWSPHLAKIISRSRLLKYLSRYYIIRPIIYIIKLFKLTK